MVIKERFLSAQEAQEARHQMDAERYENDIGEFILKMRHLNNMVRISGVTLRTTIERQLPRKMRRHLSMEQETLDDDEWLRLVVKVGKLEERFREEQRLLKG